MSPEEKKKIVSDTLIKKIEEHGLTSTIKMMGGYENFDKILPDYFYPRDKKGVLKMDRDRVIEFLNECVEINQRREGESTIYLYDYHSDILFQEWDSEGDDESEYYQYESRITSIGTDIAYTETWQYDDEGNMFDDAYDYQEIRLNRLETRFLNKIFEQLWGDFKL